VIWILISSPKLKGYLYNLYSYFQEEAGEERTMEPIRIKANPETTLFYPFLTVFLLQANS